MNNVKPITRSLQNISLIMGEGDKFLKLRMVFEEWEKEANEGKLSSIELIKLTNNFEKLIKHITKTDC